MHIARLLGPIVAAAVGLAGSEASAALSPDVGYGTAGVSTVGVSGVADEAQAVKVDGNGRAVVAGWSLTPTGSLPRQDVGVLRLNANGTADGTFGVNGHVSIQLGTALLGNAAALAFQSDGKILVAGYCTDPSGVVPDMFVARLMANGTLDSSFDGDGVVIVPRSGVHSGRVHALAVQSTGRILLAGGTAMQLGGQIIIALKPDGSLDTAFGAGGTFELHNRGFGAFHDLALLPDGRILAAGVGGDMFDPSISGGIVFTELLFVRLLVNGAVDTTFGTDGFADINVGNLAAGVGDPSMTYDNAWGVALRPDGRIVVAGQTTTDFGEFDSNTNGFVAQLLDNGALDSSFGTNHGYARLPDAGRNDIAFDVALLSNGDAIVGGQMRLAQVSPDGRMIHYTNAKVETPALAVQGDDKILVVQREALISGRFVIGRYATTALPPADNDTVPDPFTFGSVTTDRFGILVESLPITITGLTAPAIIGNANYSVGCLPDSTPFTQTITNFSVVCVRHTSGSETDPVRQTTLTIGGVASVFTSTAGDGVPDPFSFLDQTGVAPATLVVSAPVTISGITSAPNVVVADGQVSIGCNDVWVVSGIIRNGQTLCVRHTSSNEPSTVTRTTVTIGGVLDEFSSTTRVSSGSSSGGGSSSSGGGGGGGSLDWLLILALLAFQIRRQGLFSPSRLPQKKAERMTIRYAAVVAACAAIAGGAFSGLAFAQGAPANPNPTAPTESSGFNNSLTHAELQQLGDYLDRAHMLKGGNREKARAEARAQSARLASTLALSCDVTDAEQVGKGRNKVEGKTVETNIYEVACANGLGYFIVARGSDRSVAMSCFAANATHAADVAQGAKSDMYCQLPANEDVKVMAASLMTSAGTSCKVSNFQWFGQSAANTEEYSEVVCDDGKGFLLRTALPGSTAETKVMSCVEAAKQGLKCRLTDGGPVATPLTMETFRNALKQNGVSCTATQMRLVGQENVRKRYVVEVQCPEQPNGLIAFIPLDGNTNPFESIDCAQAVSRHLLCDYTVK